MTGAIRILAVWTVTRALLLLCVFKVFTVPGPDVTGDVVVIYRSWFEILRLGTFPLDDVTWQYPPAAALAILSPALLPFLDYAAAFFVLVLVCDAAVLALLWRAGRACRQTPVVARRAAAPGAPPARAKPRVGEAGAAIARRRKVLVAALRGPSGNAARGHLPLERSRERGSACQRRAAGGSLATGPDPGRGYAGAWAWVVGVPLLGPTAYARYDLMVTAVAVAALLAGARHARVLGVLAGFGALLKVWPVLLLLGTPGARVTRQAWTAAAGTVCGVLLGCAAVMPGALAFLDFQRDRGTEVESLGALVFHAARHLGWQGRMQLNYGSVEFLGPYVPLVSTVARR